MNHSSPLRPLLAATALVLAAGVVAGPPASADARPPGSASTASTTASTTWGVAPSDGARGDGRPSFEYAVEPGAVVRDHVGVTNHGTEPLRVSVSAHDAFTTEEGGFDLVTADETSTGVGAWTDLGRRAVTVAPRSRVDVPFTVTVPDDATPGDHAGGVVATVTTAGSGDRAVSVARRVGARVHLRVAGEVRPSLVVRDLRAEHRAGAPLGLQGSTVVTYDVVNEGNVRLSGETHVRVAGPFGTAARTSPPEPVPEIQPGGSVTRSVVVDGVRATGRLGVTATVVPVASGDQVLDPRPPGSTASTAAWALPWPALVVLALLAAAAVAGLVRSRRRRARDGAPDGSGLPV